MYAIYNYHFMMYFIVFIISIFVSFFLPGLYIINSIDKKISVRNIVLSYCVGFVLWTGQGYVLGYLNLRWITYLYILAVLILSYKNISLIKKVHLHAFKQIKKNKLVTVVILIGMIFQSIIMFGSGFLTTDGVHYLGSNIVDGIMHLSYIESMTTAFPPLEPGAYQHSLRNYHYWIDLNISELKRIWTIPSSYVFFQYMPLFISVITGSATYILMRLWTGSKTAGLWALFFLYLGSDGAYLFMLYFKGIFGFYTPAIDNGITQFLNMPHAGAKMIFIAALIPFYLWIKTKQRSWGLLTVGLFSSLVGYKVYFGIFAGMGLGFVVMGKLFSALFRKSRQTINEKIRSEFFSILLLILFAIVALAIYLPANSASGGLLYYPLEWPKIFLGQNNLDVRVWWLRMQVYEQAGNIRNIIIFNAYAVIVTLVCIHGTRFIGFLPQKKLYKLLGFEHMLFFIPGIITFHILGLFTLQAAGSFNVFNFFVVSTTVMAFFSAYVLYELTLRNTLWANVVILVIVLLTLPRPIYELYAVGNSIKKNDAAAISTREIDAMDYIRQNTSPNDIVQSHPKNILDSRTPYVAYFTNRQTYLSGITMIESHGQNITRLKLELNNLFELKDVNEFAKLAKENNISYLYLQKNTEQELPFSFDPPLFSRVYENDEIHVIKINEK